VVFVKRGSAEIILISQNAIKALLVPINWLHKRIANGTYNENLVHVLYSNKTKPKGVLLPAFQCRGYGNKWGCASNGNPTWWLSKYHRLK